MFNFLKILTIFSILIGKIFAQDHVTQKSVYQFIGSKINYRSNKEVYDYELTIEIVKSKKLPTQLNYTIRYFGNDNEEPLEFSAKALTLDRKSDKLLHPALNYDSRNDPNFVNLREQYLEENYINSHDRSTLVKVDEDLQLEILTFVDLRGSISDELKDLKYVVTAETTSYQNVNFVLKNIHAENPEARFQIYRDFKSKYGQLFDRADSIFRVNNKDDFEDLSFEQALENVAHDTKPTMVNFVDLSSHVSRKKYFEAYKYYQEHKQELAFKVVEFSDLETLEFAEKFKDYYKVKELPSLVVLKKSSGPGVVEAEDIIIAQGKYEQSLDALKKLFNDDEEEDQGPDRDYFNIDNINLENLQDWSISIPLPFSNLYTPNTSNIFGTPGNFNALPSSFGFGFGSSMGSFIKSLSQPTPIIELVD